jgi:hypothetical protein
MQVISHAVLAPPGRAVVTNLDTVIRNFVSVGIAAQWCGSVTVVAKFPGSVIRDVLCDI